MSELVYSFVFKILVFLILITTIMNLVPNRQYQKYIRFFAGLIFALYLLMPIVKALSGEDLLQSLESSLELNVDSEELEKYSEDINSAEEEQLIKNYQSAVEEQIDQLADENSLQVDTCNSEVTWDEEEQQPVLESIDVVVETEKSDTNDQESISEIVVEKIQVGDTSETESSTLSDQASQLKTQICQTFELEDDIVSVKEVNL